MKTVVDLFCGSGAVTLGLKSAGFQVVGALDVDPLACETYSANHPEVFLVEEDIRKINPSIFSGFLPHGLDLLVVCAPCQPFSARNRSRSAFDVRNTLVLEALSFVEILKPEAVFFENVPGMGKHPVFMALAKRLGDLGYHLGEPRRIDAVDLGVAQRRQRIIFLGAKRKEVLNQFKEIPFYPRRNVREVIGDLPVPTKSHGADPLHFSRAHAKITLERLCHIPSDGGSRNSLPEHLQLRCHRGLKESSFPDSYGRLKWDDVAPTLTTGCTDLTKGRYAHPEQDRAITLREAARLQTFPDDYVFIGTPSQIAIQIGNAVPPDMMAAIGRVLNSALSTR